MRILKDIAEAFGVAVILILIAIGGTGAYLWHHLSKFRWGKAKT